MRVGFHIGPFYFSQRVGRTQAQKRAASRARQQQRPRRAASADVWGRVQAAPTGTFSVLETSPLGPSRTWTTKADERTAGLEPGDLVKATYRLRDGRLLAVKLMQSRREELDRKARTHRYRVAKCSIDALTGGEFTLEAEDLDSIHAQLDAASAIHFLSLKIGDIVQVTLKPDKSGFEEFRHLSRANGAKPRSPVDLSAVDMEWYGLS